MEDAVGKEFRTLLTNYPELSVCEKDMYAAYELMAECHRNDGLILVCGNGGSAADSGHIVGELMKGFKLKRRIPEEDRALINGLFPDKGGYMADNLQRAIRAIALTDQVALSTAYMNDLSPDMVFAQQVYGYGRKGDLLIGLSTSGNSKNVVKACQVAKAFGLKTVGLTGRSGGEMLSLCDVTIRVPAHETYRIQEYHLPIYHALCAMMEARFFL